MKADAGQLSLDIVRVLQWEVDGAAPGHVEADWTRFDVATSRGPVGILRQLAPGDIDADRRRP